MEDSCSSILQLALSGDDQDTPRQSSLLNTSELLPPIWDSWPPTSSPDECGSSCTLLSDFPSSKDLISSSWLSTSLQAISEIGGPNYHVRQNHDSESTSREDLICNMSLFPITVTINDMNISGDEELAMQSAVSSEHTDGTRDPYREKTAIDLQNDMRSFRLTSYPFNNFQHVIEQQIKDALKPFSGSQTYDPGLLHVRQPLGNEHDRHAYEELFQKEDLASTSYPLFKTRILENLTPFSPESQVTPSGYMNQVISAATDDRMAFTPPCLTASPVCPYMSGNSQILNDRVTSVKDHDNNGGEDSTSSTGAMSQKIRNSALAVSDSIGSPHIMIKKHQRDEKIWNLTDKQSFPSPKRACLDIKPHDRQQNAVSKKCHGKALQLSCSTSTSYASQLTDVGVAGVALNTNGKPRARRGSATDPQSVYARHRREKINERLKTLQHLIPNGAKVDIVTMLEEAINYVKFLQLQVKLLSSDEYWIYAPTTYNGMSVSFDMKIGLSSTN
ncbi:hypothetical protein O6H91_Y464800 [Diphasiastrum complanatum]|nr:hypothetical protein O6H91_Y464800 [Diphasiastrum complanatum]